MQNNNKNHNFTDRRSGRDFLYRAMVGINIFAWLIFVIVMCMFHFARPELETGFGRFLNVYSRTSWNSYLVNWMFLLLCGCVLLSTLVILIRKRRARRRTDGVWANVFFLVITSVISLIYLWINADVDL
ncbi:hypothetical protein H8B19_00335 [Neptunicella marina]|uniref:Uncharacterized protein n=2 Tax=Neptunicella marina TaxID=2125989 RepID=A0A8J6IMR7_9ALTE|nr:hypothetical protein [Neptunicella marina]